MIFIIKYSFWMIFSISMIFVSDFKNIFITLVPNDPFRITWYIIGLFIIGIVISLYTLLKTIKEMRLTRDLAESKINFDPTALHSRFRGSWLASYYQQWLTASTNANRVVEQDQFTQYLDSHITNGPVKVVQHLSTILVSLGMIGTVYGLYDMGDHIGNFLNFEDTDRFNHLQALFHVIGSALGTTLLGLFFGQIWLRNLNNAVIDERRTILSGISVIAATKFLPLIEAKIQERQEHNDTL